jgi:hypothetical protein
MSEITFESIMKEMREKLNEQPRKISLHPPLPIVPIPAARVLKTLKILRSYGACLHLLDRSVNLTSMIHAISRPYIKLYKVCKELGVSVVNHEGTNYGLINTFYKGKLVGVYLGKRKPLIKMDESMKTLSRQEYIRLHNRLARYLNLIDEADSLPRMDEIARFDEFVLVRRDSDDMPLETYTPFLSITRYATAQATIYVRYHPFNIEGGKPCVE